jgi:hypothetical protein
MVLNAGSKSDEFIRRGSIARIPDRRMVRDWIPSKRPVTAMLCVLAMSTIIGISMLEPSRHE